MSSQVDFCTALNGIREANSDFLQLISQLKTFLTTGNTVTFYLDNEIIPVDGLLTLIDNYKNGKFDSIILDNGDSKVVLSVDAYNNLVVTDASGNLLDITCERLDTAVIEDSDIKTVTLQECNVESVTGTVSVHGGNVTLESLTTGKFNADNAYASSLNAAYAQVGNCHIQNLLIQGDHRMDFTNVRNIFARADNSPVNDFASKMVIVENVWTNWEYYASPSMLGIFSTESPIPSLICFQGNNKYDDFTTKKITNVAVRPASMPGSFPLTNTASQDLNLQVAAVFGFPFMEYEDYSEGSDPKNLIVKEFNDADIGKELYYRTGGSPWKIYRTLTINYDNGTPVSATLGDLYEIPAYSCVRFTLAHIGSALEGQSVSIIEVA